MLMFLAWPVSTRLYTHLHPSRFLPCAPYPITNKSPRPIGHGLLLQICGGDEGDRTPYLLNAIVTNHSVWNKYTKNMYDTQSQISGSGPNKPNVLHGVWTDSKRAFLRLSHAQNGTLLRWSERGFVYRLSVCGYRGEENQKSNSVLSEFRNSCIKHPCDCVGEDLGKASGISLYRTAMQPRYTSLCLPTGPNPV